MPKTIAIAALLLLGSGLLISCTDDSDTPPGLSRAEVEEIVQANTPDAPAPADPGLSRAEVEEIVQANIPDAPAPADPGLSRAEVEQIVQDAIAGIPRPDTGLTHDEVSTVVNETVVEMLEQLPPAEPSLTREEVQRIARTAVASIPPKSAPADYTKFFVENAIAKFNTEGLAATLDYYNRVESIDGQWYVFIVDQDDTIIGHYDSHLLGEDLNGPIGTDANGYNFGPEMLSATDQGKWVSYVFRNPETGVLSSDFEQFELKNVWVVRNAGLLFGSGWYIQADEFTKQLVSVAVERFHFSGLPATMEYFASPVSALVGLEAAIAYYNEAETVEGQWFAFIGDENGRIVAHSDPAMIGRETQDLFGTETFEATAEGGWVTTDSLRVWVVGHQGFVFGSGWRQTI